MESKAKREGEAAAGGVDATIAAAPIAATLAPATAAAAVDGLAKPPQIHFQRPVTADVQQHAPILPQSAAARQDVAAAAPLHSNQSQCKSCTDASARLEALQVRAERFCPKVWWRLTRVGRREILRSRSERRRWRRKKLC